MRFFLSEIALQFRYALKWPLILKQKYWILRFCKLLKMATMAIPIVFTYLLSKPILFSDFMLCMYYGNNHDPHVIMLSQV